MTETLYRIANDTDDSYDPLLHVGREVRLASGVILLHGIATFYLSDMPKTSIGSGLFKPTSEETLKFAGSIEKEPPELATVEIIAKGEEKKLDELAPVVAAFAIEHYACERKPNGRINSEITEQEKAVFTEAWRQTERARSYVSVPGNVIGMYL